MSPGKQRVSKNTPSQTVLSKHSACKKKAKKANKAKPQDKCMIQALQIKSGKDNEDTDEDFQVIGKRVRDILCGPQDNGKKPAI